MKESKYNELFYFNHRDLVQISEFCKNSSKYLGDVARPGKKIILTHFGKPVCLLVSLNEPVSKDCP